MKWMEWVFAIWFMLHVADSVLSTALEAQQGTGKAVVLDGDTIRLGQTHYRLDGIDAPELWEPYGQEARRQLQQIIDIDQVNCRWEGATSYRRLVAVCSTVHYPDIGAELIRRGFALDCTRYSGGRYRKLEPRGARQTLLSKKYCD